MLLSAVLLLALAAPIDDAAPAGYPDAFPYIEGARLKPGAKKGTLQLLYAESDKVLFERLTAEAEKAGWRIELTSALDPSAGRLLVAHKDGRKVLVSVGREQATALLVLREVRGERAPELDRACRVLDMALRLGLSQWACPDFESVAPK